jgi:phosphoribosyl 1,2-cyclic phosphodiesterase
MKSFKIKFWGVRGSIPTPGRSTVHYGGNTSCVEVRFKEGPFFILDAGTGIRELGKFLQQQNEKIRVFIFISHFHWDHIQGLPFFRPAFDAENSITIAGSDDAAAKLAQIISFQMDPTYFPVTIEDMNANISFRSLKEEKFAIEGVEIQTLYLNHPGYALGYRFSYKNHCLVYISDNEPFHQSPDSERSVSTAGEVPAVEQAFDNFYEDKNKKLIEFCRKADVLIHDAQFLPEEYESRKTWGHSPFHYPIDLALQSQVKSLILFHHDPDHGDKAISQMLQQSRKIIRKRRSSLKCEAAREGSVLVV